MAMRGLDLRGLNDWKRFGIVSLDSAWQVRFKIVVESDEDDVGHEKTEDGGGASPEGGNREVEALSVGGWRKGQAVQWRCQPICP